jgi:hypothetical protein
MQMGRLAKVAGYALVAALMIAGSGCVAPRKATMITAA